MKIAPEEKLTFCSPATNNWCIRQILHLTEHASVTNNFNSFSSIKVYSDDLTAAVELQSYLKNIHIVDMYI